MVETGDKLANRNGRDDSKHGLGGLGVRKTAKDTSRDDPEAFDVPSSIDHRPIARK